MRGHGPNEVYHCHRVNACHWCKPGMPQICQQLKRQTAKEREMGWLAFFFLGPWEKLSTTLSLQEYRLGPKRGGLTWGESDFTEASHGVCAGMRHRENLSWMILLPKHGCSCLTGKPVLGWAALQCSVGWMEHTAIWRNRDEEVFLGAKEGNQNLLVL